MLNPTFSRAAKSRITTPYVAPNDIAASTVAGNEAFDTGDEFRLQRVYGDEIWMKMERAGLSPARLSQSSVLEVCAGTGYLTHHLLERCTPKQLTVNDISAVELRAAKALMLAGHPNVAIDWVLGDVHRLNFGRKFDVIVGNSFLHHFHDVPAVLRRFASLLSPGGCFVSLHEPTPMAMVVEGAKVAAYPLACLAPGFVNEIARSRYRGDPSRTDIWVFEPRALRKVAIENGFAAARCHSWHLLRPIVVQTRSLHLSASKPALRDDEASLLRRTIVLDSVLNRILPSRCFGSFTLVCEK
jgi:ubiquinone/menaquinone biosynthesis C-methylase UbiE